MYRPEPQKELETHSFDIELRYSSTAQNVLDAIQQIKDKCPNVSMEDITFTGGYDGEIFVEYTHYEKNPNYEAEMKEWEEDTRQDTIELLQSTLAAVNADIGTLDHRLQRLEKSNFDPNKIQEEIKKVKDQRGQLVDKGDSLKKRIDELKNQ